MKDDAAAVARLWSVLFIRGVVAQLQGRERGRGWAEMRPDWGWSTYVLRLERGHAATEQRELFISSTRCISYCLCLDVPNNRPVPNLNFANTYVRGQIRTANNKRCMNAFKFWLTN